jgi:hypothetical protein
MRLTGILLNPACSSPNAPICTASACRFASQRLRSAVAAERLSDGSGSADTTYVSTVNRRFGSAGFVASACAWVANHDEYVPARKYGIENTYLQT